MGIGANARMKNPTALYTEYRQKRGMSVIHDWTDWLGGYPFEVASPAAIIQYYETRGFRLVKVKKASGLGNNEYVFRRE